MEIIKRTGQTELYDGQKIVNAIKKAFDSTSNSQPEELYLSLLSSVESKLEKENTKTVEAIQDLVEQTLMEQGHFEEAKRYILFRQKRSEFRAARNELLALFLNDEVVKELSSVLLDIQHDYPEYSILVLKGKFLSFMKETMSLDEQLSALVHAAIELVTPQSPQWEFIAGRLLNYQFLRRLNRDLEELAINSFYEKISYLTQEGLYGDYILHSYSKSEIDQAQDYIKNERDLLFTYSALDLLLNRYVIRTHKHIPMERPQEMFMGIALYLAIGEKNNRMEWVFKFYDMISTLEVTMATPTLANARKPYHQLSSCFIDTVGDSLDSIYRSIDNFAKVSKLGGGMGLYFGKVRATGSSIRGFEGAAGGIIRWIRLVNDTAVAVDQLGVRTGAVAVYLDVWHKDLLEFLSIRTNNGDERMKAHDVFPGVCYPDLFWKMAKEDLNQTWYLMCPHDIYKAKGYHLEDYYGDEWERKYNECILDNRITKRGVSIKDVVRLILKSAVETGTPFVFNRDIVNKANPNGHKGIIYCSNLCTEIAQNMSAIEYVSTEIKDENGDKIVVTTTKSGDFVVCNLASLSLGNINLNDKAHLKDVVATAIRALDNVIDLNYFPLSYAKITSEKYRSIGLGVSGYHHMLAKNGIKWESQQHLDYVDALFEEINYAAIEASCNISKEKGHYLYFEGSDWQTGAYFSKRGYDSPKWNKLKKEVATYGMRNSYLLAIAPTSSTSILASTTAGVDPVMKRWFLEEKKGFMLTRTAPELSEKTWWYYKNAHQINQRFSIQASGVRQRHIDQAQSMNLYITNDYTMREVLDLYLLAWESGVKTIYYVRSKSLEVEECESCSS